MPAHEQSDESPVEPSSPEKQDFDHTELDSKPRIEKQQIIQLKPHPRNEAIYGTEDVAELVERIRQSGWLKPLVCTQSGIIISGHRRWLAAKELGLESLFVEVREFADDTAELEAILLENASREKTTEQKVREAEAWREIEVARAKLRKTAAQNNQAGRAVQEIFPELLDVKGQARDAIANRVGLGSGRTYDKASAVVQEIDMLAQDAPEAAMGFRKLLNEHSVTTAHKLLKKPAPQRRQILSLIGKGEAKSTKEAEQMIKEDSSMEFNENDTAQSKKNSSTREKQPEGLDWACKLIVNRSHSTNSEQQNKILSAFVPSASPDQLAEHLDQQQIEPFWLAFISRISPENLRWQNWTESQPRFIFEQLKQELDRRSNFESEEPA